MTDTTHDDLVKRLRYLGDHASFEPHMHHTAADRIEELEAKLARAAASLQDIEGRSRPINPTGNPKWVNDHARATLAELKGQDDE